MDKDRFEYVPLPQAVDKIRTIRKCDVDVARQIVKEAHQLGDLDLRVRRPDGSIYDQLDRAIWNASPWSDPNLIFENGGIINAEAPRPPRYLHRPRSLRRVQPTERCRVVATCKSLDAFLKTNRPSRVGAPEEYDWEEGKQFLLNELKRRGSPREKVNRTNAWKSVSDAARLVAKHLAKRDQHPDFTTIRKKTTAWIEEFELGQN
jgi:hypothetical protein